MTNEIESDYYIVLSYVFDPNKKDFDFVIGLDPIEPESEIEQQEKSSSNNEELSHIDEMITNIEGMTEEEVEALIEKENQELAEMQETMQDTIPVLSEDLEEIVETPITDLAISTAEEPELSEEEIDSYKFNLDSLIASYINMILPENNQAMFATMETVSKKYPDIYKIFYSKLREKLPCVSSTQVHKAINQ